MTTLIEYASKPSGCITVHSSCYSQETAFVEMCKKSLVNHRRDYGVTINDKTRRQSELSKRKNKQVKKIVCFLV